MRLEKLNLSFIHLIFLAMAAIAIRPTLLRAVPKAVAFRGQAVSFVNGINTQHLNNCRITRLTSRTLFLYRLLALSGLFAWCHAPLPPLLRSQNTLWRRRCAYDEAMRAQLTRSKPFRRI